MAKVLHFSECTNKGMVGRVDCLGFSVENVRRRLPAAEDRVVFDIIDPVTQIRVGS